METRSYDEQGTYMLEKEIMFVRRGLDRRIIG